MQLILFKRHGMWWAQTNDVFGLVTGIGGTAEEAKKAWERAYARTKQSMKSK